MKELTKDERAAAMAIFDGILDDCPRFTRDPTPTEMDSMLRTIVDLRDGWVAVGRREATAKRDTAKAHMHEAKRLIREAWQAWDSDRDSKCGKRIGDASRAVDAAIRALEATA